MALAVTTSPPGAARVSTVRGFALLAAAVALAALHLPWRPRTVCLLRATTGIPCPLCGGTTAAVEMGRADVLAAVRASPLAVVGAVAFVAAPLARRAGALSSRTIWLLVVVVATASELYQLARFGLL